MTPRSGSICQTMEPSRASSAVRGDPAMIRPPAAAGPLPAGESRRVQRSSPVTRSCATTSLTNMPSSSVTARCTTTTSPTTTGGLSTVPVCASFHRSVPPGRSTARSAPPRVMNTWLPSTTAAVPAATGLSGSSPTRSGSPVSGSTRYTAPPASMSTARPWNSPTVAGKPAPENGGSVNVWTHRACRAVSPPGPGPILRTTALSSTDHAAPAALVSPSR